MTQSSIQSPEQFMNCLSQASRRLDALAKLLIEKWLITREEFIQKISEERPMYQKLLNPTPQ